MSDSKMVSVDRDLLEHLITGIQIGDRRALMDMAKKIQVALYAPAEDVRTPKDYAIEHAEYMATAGDQVLVDYQAYTLAQMSVDEGGDDGDEELTDAIDAARDHLHEGLSNLRRMIYEFRKRRDRAEPESQTALQPAQ